MDTHFSRLKPEDVEYVLVATNNGGPLIEDLYFIILTQDSYWKISSVNAKPVFEFLKLFPDVDWEQSIQASGCTAGRVFIIWRRDGRPNFSGETRNKLQERLNSFIAKNFSMPSEQRALLVQSIFSAYEQEHRFYHGIRHIHHCLHELDSLKEERLNKDQIELAIWYHDLIYIPRSKCNEIASAEKLLADFKYCKSQICLEKVADMIRESTHTQSNEIIDMETQVFIDIDLSILGQSDVEYLVYKQNIRLEYQKIPMFIYAYRRKKILKQLLKDGIFRTPRFRDKYSAKARENIQGELAKAPFKFIPTLECV